MNLSTPDLNEVGFEKFEFQAWFENSGVKMTKLLGLIDISTLDFSTPKFNFGLFYPRGLKVFDWNRFQEFKVEKSGVEKSGLKRGVENSGVEIFCNLDGATVAVGTFFLARFGFESVWFSWLFLEDFDTHFNKGLALSYKSLTCGTFFKNYVQRLRDSY